jgi:hypothetical protein
MHNFTLVSFDADGHTLKNAAERPAFYALVWRSTGKVIDYYNTLESARVAAERLSVL